MPPIQSDVSDEALEKLIFSATYRDHRGVIPFTPSELLAFAKRIRDLTKDHCAATAKAGYEKKRKLAIEKGDEFGAHWRNHVLAEANGYIMASEDIHKLSPSASLTTEEVKADGEG